MADQDHDDTPSDTSAGQGGVDADVARGIREAAAAFRLLVQQSTVEKVYWYWSPKGRQYFEVRGDTAFMMLILDEFNPHVVRIEIESPQVVETVGGEPTGTRFDATITYRDGSQILKEAKRVSSLADDARSKFQIEAQKKAAAKRGAGYELVLDESLRKRSVRFWNSLALLGWINRCRDVSTTAATAAVDAFLKDKSGATLGDLIEVDSQDPATVLAVVARRVAFGALHVDLDRPMTRRTFFASDPGAIEQVDDRTETAERDTPTRRLPPRGDFGKIPLHLLDMNAWPRVDEAFVRERDHFTARREAVELFYDGGGAKEIFEKTGLREQQVVELIIQCAKEGFDGRASGFPALVKFGYLRGYKRQNRSTHNNRVDPKRGGMSGELELLLSMHPDLITTLETLTLEYYASRAGKRLKWSDIRDAFLEACEKKIGDPKIPPAKQLTRDLYPFNTKSLGYRSIIKFCKELRQGSRSRFVSKRFGKEAAKRAMLGSGGGPLFVATAPYQAGALDFYKVDAETVVQQTLPDKTQLDVITPRWFIGSIVCMHGGFPIADSISLEYQQTTEDVLALGAALACTPGHCAELAAEYRVAADGKWLPGQLVPALANSGVDLLLLDRAWAHQSRQSLAKLSQSLGAVICFCAPAAWEQKAPVERHFADLVDGLHTLPSSVGSGPKDPRRKGAGAMAVRYQINVDRTVRRIRAEIRRILNRPSVGSNGLGHLERLQQLCLKYDSEWLPRPLPRARVADNPLSWIDVEGKVAAGTEENPRLPHVRPLGIRFYGPQLERREDLIDRDVIVQIKHDRFNEARVVVAGTGEVIGSVRPQRRYNVEGLTYRMVRLIQKKLGVTDIDTSLTNPVLDFAENNKKVLAERRKRTRKKTEPVRGGREALDAAQMDRSGLSPNAPPASEPSAAPRRNAPMFPTTTLSIGSFSRRPSR